MGAIKKKPERKATILYRSEKNKMLGGVCGGLGEVFDLDPTLVRALFLIAFLFGGSGIILYLILWIIIPTESKLKKPSEDNVRENIEEMKDKARELTGNFRASEDNGRLLVGVLVIVAGIMFLLSNFGFSHIFNFDKLWPIFIIIIGIAMLFRRNERK